MSLSTLEQISRKSLSSLPSATRGRRLDPWAIAVLACVITMPAMGRAASLWFDEGATISASANRTVLNCGRW